MDVKMPPRGIPDPIQLITLGLWIYVLGALLPPVFMRAGLQQPAAALYTVYSFFCHQLPQRSFFLFGEKPAYTLEDLKARVGLERLPGYPWPRAFIGDPELGWKIALCQRDLAIYGAMALSATAMLVRGHPWRPLPLWAFVIFGLAPITLDGGSQFMSYMLATIGPFTPRESTPILRVITGALFGSTFAWMLFSSICDAHGSGHRSGFVAIIGKPNVGKSTLLNAYIGTKISIVSPKPQTTRQRILGVLTRPDAQVIFMDTPGIHHPFHKLGEYMVEVARRAIPDADVIVFLVDVSEWPDDEDRMIADLLKERAADKPVILAMNKIDLLKSDRESHLMAYRTLAPTPPDAEPPFPWEEVQISAVRGDNLDLLLERIIAHLPEGPRYYDPDMLTDQPLQMIVAELIREKALLLLREEVPHGIAVEITDWVDRNPNLTYIAATIYVEKETHKPIVIGENGQMLKRIGAAARQEIEALLGHSVYLELWVKVRKNWRRDPEQLRQLGYALPRERKGRR